MTLVQNAMAVQRVGLELVNGEGIWAETAQRPATHELFSVPC